MIEEYINQSEKMIGKNVIDFSKEDRESSILTLQAEKERLLLDSQMISRQIELTEKQKIYENIYSGDVNTLNVIAQKLENGEDLNPDENKIVENFPDLIASIRKTKWPNNNLKNANFNPIGLEGEGIEWGQNLAKKINTEVDEIEEVDGKMDIEEKKSFVVERFLKLYEEFNILKSKVSTKISGSLTKTSEWLSTVKKGTFNFFENTFGRMKENHKEAIEIDKKNLDKIKNKLVIAREEFLKTKKELIDKTIENAGKFKNTLKKSEEWWLDTNKNKVAKAGINALMTVAGSYATGFVSTDIASKGFWRIVQAGAATGLFTSESAQKFVAQTAEKFLSINARIDKGVESFAGENNKNLKLYKNALKGGLILGAGLASASLIVSTGIVSASSLAVSVGGAGARLGLTKAVDYYIKKNEGQRSERFIKNIKWAKSFAGLGLSITTADLLLLSHSGVESAGKIMPINKESMLSTKIDNTHVDFKTIHENNFEEVPKIIKPSIENTYTPIKSELPLQTKIDNTHVNIKPNIETNLKFTSPEDVQEPINSNLKEIDYTTPPVNPANPETPTANNAPAISKTSYTTPDKSHFMRPDHDKGEGVTHVIKHLNEKGEIPEAWQKAIGEHTTPKNLGDFGHKVGIINKYNNSLETSEGHDQYGFVGNKFMMAHDGQQVQIAHLDDNGNIVKDPWEAQMTDEKFMHTGKIQNIESSTESANSDTDFKHQSPIETNHNEGTDTPIKTDAEKIEDLRDNLKGRFRTSDDQILETDTNTKDGYFKLNEIALHEYTAEAWAKSPDNIYGINLEQLKVVDDLHHTNLDMVVKQSNISNSIDENQFNSVLKYSHAETMFSLEENQIEENFKPLWNYMHKIEEITGLKYIKETPLHPVEKNEDYIFRGLMKAAQLGKLDQVKL